ncbi:MAG: winged helix-turn-helix domain-containing protein [Acidobacteriota bacterium]|nr:winged helix-turn-helix domain-containing protein [Acidobacteriota bacterium]
MKTKQFYDFGDFRLDVSEKALFHDGTPVSLTPKVFKTLLVLIENAGNLVGKDELMSRIWGDRFVEESNLTFNIKMLRKALGDDAAHPRFIENVPRRGYRFIAEVREAVAEELEYRDLEIQSFGPKVVKTNGAHPFENGSLGEKKALKSSLPAIVSLSIVSRPVFYSIVAILLGVFILTGFFVLRNQTTVFQKIGVSANSGRSSRLLSVEKLTDTGGANAPNISPDGKLLVYFTQEGGRNTVWLRQLTTGKSIQILTLTDEFLHGTSFTPDGEYIIYSHQRKGESGHLSRVSILGGAPTKIINNHHGGWSFSPDGSQIAFVRLEEAGSAIMIAGADGAGERKITVSQRPRAIIGISWSPDGKSLAYCAGNFHSNAKDFRVFEINLQDGTEKTLTDFVWAYLENVMWLPDKSGLLVNGRGTPEGADQIWRVSLPDGKTEQITNSTDSLYLRGATKDFSRIIGSQKFLNASVWIAPSDNLANIRPIAKAQYDFAWTPDGKIVLPARDTIAADIWLVNPDGSERKQLTVNDAIERRPAVSPVGRFVVFVSNQNGTKNIWRTDIDGKNPLQLTWGEGENYPTFMPDGQSVVFNSSRDGSLWQIPITGGEAKLISKEKSFRIAFSPDGKKFAYFGPSGGRRKLLVKSFPDCKLLKEFDIPIASADAPRVVWTKDEKFLIFDNFDSQMVSNLWRQSLTGGDPEKLTNFTSERISDFGFSPDGKHLAIVRGQWIRDAVLLKGF